MADSPELTRSPDDKHSTVPSFVGSAKSSRSSKSVKEPVEKAKQGTIKPHGVTVTVTVAVAYPKPTDEHSKLLEELVKRNKKTVDAPRANQYLHCEYLIAPQQERTITDVVTYSVAAKIFTENDSRVVKTWDDGQNVWVAWMHSHEIEVTSKNVMSLYNHTVNMKIWDAKDKVSVKARSDRPKAFRLPSATESGIPGKGVQGVVARQSNSWLNVQPRDSVIDIKDQQNKNLHTLLDETVTADKENKEALTNLQPIRVRSTLGRLAGINASDEEKKRINELKKQQAVLQKELERNGGMLRNTEKRLLKEPKAGAPVPRGAIVENSAGFKKTNKADAKTAVTSARCKPVNISVKLESLFGGVKTVSSKLSEPSGSVCDCYVTLSLDGPLLPHELEKSLNPLVINLKAVKDLPATPIPYQQLSELCKPVHCQYSFLGHPTHVTASRPHGKHIYFEDVHVILLGLLDEGEVREFIQGNKLMLEVHDRDQKEQSDTGQATIFGEERDDDKLSNVGLVSAKRTAFNAFRSKKQGFDPYGVAHMPLVDVLRGQTTIRLQANVNPSPVPDMLRDNPDLSGKTRLVGISGEVDRPQRPPLHPGHYIHAGTTVKMTLTLSHPFVPAQNVPCLLPLPNQVCPFSRVIYYFSYSNKTLLKQIEELVTSTNAKALKLDQFEKDVLDAALSTYKLSMEQKKSKTLDVITGFHLIDGNLHWMVLEGLREGAMQTLLQAIQRKEPKDGEVLVHLFDSSLSFSTRLYSGLDVDLCRVRLHQPITKILQQPLLYVRDMVPHKCLECLTKMHEISNLTKLRDVVHSNCFPTSEMVISMSREFGVPLTYEDFENKPEIKNNETDKANELLIKESEPKKKYPGRRWTPIDNKNSQFMELIRQRDYVEAQADYVTLNIVAVQEAGKRRRPLHPTVGSLSLDIPAHNYSTQTLNTTELAKDKLRQMLLQQDPDARYAYHPTYNSAMLVPINVDAYYKEQDEAARRAWKTEQGMLFPGMKSSRECNEHPLKPDDSRIEELRLKFRDNVLHRNILEPTLQRDRMSWDHRKEDVELYRRPVSYFGSSPPVTIHLAGQLLKEEQLKNKRMEEEEWRSRVVVDEDRMKFHRVLPGTEQTNKSNQLDRLTCLLKDEPKKLALKRPPVPEIPPLSVVQNPSVDRAARARGVKLPPAFDESREKNVGFMVGPYDDSSWNMERNKVPIKDPHHQYFAEKWGHDMNLYHKERGLLSKHFDIKELTDEEKQNHLFRIPPLQPKFAKQLSDEIKDDTDDLSKTEDHINTSSEYRIQYPPYKVLPRLHEIYPRHTFHGLAPLTDDGKPVTRDASIGLVGSRENATVVTSNRHAPGTMHENEASVEISQPPIAVSS
nr:uncharacterized protein LOC100176752 [Ciona intestinalis]|eukprot:XP_018669380.1 uncharacterized protein LOC100176752 [Ciona intestinalis]